MAQPYRTAEPSLQELLAGNAVGYAPQNPVMQGGDPGAAAQGVDPALYAQAFAPEDLGPRPEVSKPSTLARILTGFGDALNTGASILGRTDVRSHYSQAYEDYLQSQRNAAEQFDRLNAREKTRASRDKAQFLLGRQENQAKTAAEKAALQEERQYKEGVAKKATEAAATADALDRAATATKEAEKLSWEKEKAKAEIDKDLAVARIHASSKDNPHANYDIKTLPTVMQGLAGLADSAEVALNGGDPAKEIPAMTPQQMRNSIRRNIEASGLSPDGKKAAYAFATSEVEQVIRDFEQAHAPVQGPETQPRGGGAGPTDEELASAVGALGRGAGRVLTTPFTRKF